MMFNIHTASEVIERLTQERDAALTEMERLEGELLRGNEGLFRFDKLVSGLKKERDAALGRVAAWSRIDGPGIDGQRVMLRELDPFDRFNRGDENRDAIASGYWSAEYGHYVWPFGCTDHPPTHWAPMPERLTGESKEGGA